MPEFVCGYLANHSDGQLLVELTENPSAVTFNDIGKISDIYWDYKNKNGKQLNTKEKRKKDNFKKNLKSSFPKEVTTGRTNGKAFLTYEVEDGALWNLLKSNYSRQKNPHTVIRTFTKKYHCF